jgi:hypothetical protein
MPPIDSAPLPLVGAEEPFSFSEEPMRDERKRYTTQLQRRAQAHITAELGGTTVVPDTDRQVTMVIQHAQAATGARRVSFFRPVTRGRRWHVATVLEDGAFYYGLSCPDTMGWSRISYEQRRPVLFDAEDRRPETGPTLSDLGLRSYLGVPVLADGRAVAVIEAVVDLVLRQPYEVDETFEVAPNEWAVLNGVNGDRPIKAVAEQASMPVSQVLSIASALVERGLVRLGKENRRRL